MSNSKKLSLLFVCLVWGFSVVAVAQQNAIPPAPHILVYGQAEARVIPDRFKISIDIQALDIDSNAARKSVAKIFDETLEKLVNAAVELNNIVATDLNVRAVHEYQRTGEQVYKGTQVHRKIDAIFADNESLEEFLQGMETNQNLSISGVQTEYSDSDELKRALRKEAIKSSREKATVLAEEYGVSIKGIYSVSDVPPSFNYGVRPGAWPTSLEWVHGQGDPAELDRVDVTGSRLDPNYTERFRTGYVTYQDRIYTVFLIEENAAK